MKYNLCSVTCLILLVIFIKKKEKTVHNTQKIYFEKLPGGLYELNISCDRSVAWSGVLSYLHIFIFNSFKEGSPSTS